MQEVYDKLHAIWLERGFDDDPHDSQLRNELEHVMEKTWYERPGGSIEDAIAHH